MSRPLHVDIAGELVKHKLNTQPLVHFAFDSGDLRVWPGPADLVAGGETWIGAGTLLSISQVEENSEIVAGKVDFGRNGVSNSLISLALGEHYQGRTVEMFLCFFDENGAVIQTPVPIYKGKLDIMELEDDGRKCSIIVRAESRLRNLRQAPLTRYTDQDQKALFPGDRFFEFLPQMQEKRLIWGRG